jgi:hypothetical protein
VAEGGHECSRAWDWLTLAGIPDNSISLVLSFDSSALAGSWAKLPPVV